MATKAKRGMAQAGARFIVSALVTAALTGCIILPPEARNLVSDVSAIKSDVEQVDIRLNDIRREISTDLTAFREDERTRFRQVHDGNKSILAKIDALERELRDLRAIIEERPVGGATPNASAAPNPLSSIVTTGGIVLSADELLSQAGRRLDRAEYGEAADIFQLIATQFADSDVADDAQLGLAKCLEYTNQMREALAAYSALPTAFPGSELVSEAKFRGALCARNLGDTPRALQLLNEIVLQDPGYRDMALVKREMQQITGAP